MTAVTAPAEVKAPPHWRRIDFISDLHLAVETPKTFEAWSRYMRHTPADAVFILGDLFEVWVGDDARFEGFEGQCAEVLATAAESRDVAFMQGNRDFLVGRDMLDACSVRALPDPCVLIFDERRFVLTHGDELCLDDVEYQRFRQQVRNPAWQKALLAQPLQARRDYARQVRAQSDMRKRERGGPESWADVDRVEAERWMDSAGALVMIHGHTHRPGDEAWSGGRSRIVLSDWDLDHEPHRAEVLRLTSAGLERLTAEQAAPER